MIKEAFKLAKDENDNIVIVQVEITDLEGVSWREAKKQLRKWYLDQAAVLRSITQETYFSQ
mgnify:CR=1 FL=1